METLAHHWLVLKILQPNIHMEVYLNHESAAKHYAKSAWTSRSQDPPLGSSKSYIN
jgi:hypothetical protein